MNNIRRFEILLTLVAAGAGFAAAQGVPPNCEPDLSACYIPKNVLIELPPPLTFIAGDAVVQKGNSTETTAVFRVNNDFSNTARGTGLGVTAFLYSADGTTRLPDPSTYSLNAQYVTLSTTGPTFYTGAPVIFPPIQWQLDLSAAPVSVQYTGAKMAGSYNSVLLSATVTSGGQPVAGGAVYFSLGTQSCNALTDATGKATCSIVLNQHQGHYDVAAAFAGIFGTYAGGSDTRSFVVTGE